MTRAGTVETCAALVFDHDDMVVKACLGRSVNSGRNTRKRRAGSWRTTRATWRHENQGGRKQTRDRAEKPSSPGSEALSNVIHLLTRQRTDARRLGRCKRRPGLHGPVEPECKKPAPGGDYPYGRKIGLRWIVRQDALYAEASAAHAAAIRRIARGYEADPDRS